MLTILCERLSGAFDMEVVCDGQGDMPGRLEARGILVRRLALTTKWSFGARIPQLAAVVRKTRPDLVHLHGQFAGSLGQLALQLAGRPPSVYTAQWPSFLDDGGAWSRLRNRTAERLSCGPARAVVAVSEHDRREYLHRHLCDESKIDVIPNAYFLETDGETVKAAAPVIGFVGRLVDQKGCEFLVRAIPHVLESHSEAKFQIVGDGPERGRLEALGSELGIGSALEFTGYDPKPERRMRQMAVLAVPSLYEPLGMVALEAMACGIPVVAAAVGGLPEAVEDGRTGLLVPPADARALAAALVRVLDSPELRASMGAAGRDRATRLFSPEFVAGRYAALYERVLARTAS